MSIFWAAMVLTVVILLFGALTWYMDPPPKVDSDRPYNDLVKAAVDIRLDQSRTVFQVLLLVSGALLGILIAKPGEVRLVLADWPEVIMSLSAALLLGLSLICHIGFMHEVRDAYVTGGSMKAFDKDNASMPDVFSGTADYWFNFQWGFLAFGTLISLGVLYNTHRLKDEE